MSEILVHHFQTNATRYTIDDMDHLHEFIDNVCDGDRDQAHHWINSCRQGELVIVGHNGPVDEMFVLSSPSDRDGSERVIRYERDTHVSYLMRALDELDSIQRHPAGRRKPRLRDLRASELSQLSRIRIVGE